MNYSASKAIGKPHPEDVKIPTTPAEALQVLIEGNRRFADGKSMASHRDIGRVRQVAKEQEPFAAFLGCADSRVPIEIVFDQGFGDLFVTRIAGNVASSENIGSLEFGTHILGAKVLYVLGHTECGAVTATMKGTDVPGQISGLFQHIRPAVKAAQGCIWVTSSMLRIQPLPKSTRTSDYITRGRDFDTMIFSSGSWAS
jgi:carbonic anhydrase